MLSFLWFFIDFLLNGVVFLFSQVLSVFGRIIIIEIKKNDIIYMFGFGSLSISINSRWPLVSAKNGPRDFDINFFKRNQTPNLFWYYNHHHWRFTWYQCQINWIAFRIGFRGSKLGHSKFANHQKTIRTSRKSVKLTPNGYGIVCAGAVRCSGIQVRKIYTDI